MKRVLVLIVSLLILGGGVAFAGTIGPAQPETLAGQLSLGPGFMYYTGNWDNHTNFEQNEVYIQAGLGIFDGLEIYLQGGAADLTVDHLFDSGNYEDGFRPFGAVGIKGLLARHSPISIGYFAQGSYFSNYKDTGRVGGNQVRFDIKKDYGINGGLMLQATLEGAVLYGGPLFYSRGADLDTTVGTQSYTYSFEEQGNFGGVLGVRWRLNNGVHIDLETQLKSSASVAGDILFNF